MKKSLVNINMAFILLATLEVSAAVLPAGCWQTDAKGVKRILPRADAKYITIKSVKDCKEQPMLIPYDNKKGMRLYVNPMPNQLPPCLFLGAKNGQLYVQDGYEVDPVLGMVCR